HEFANLPNLLRPQRQVRRRFGPHHAIGVEPGVVHAHFDQFVQPRFADQIDVRLTDAGGDADDQLVPPARLQSRQGFAEYVEPPAALVADHFLPLDADQGRRVADLAQAGGDLVGDQLPVGEDLEVAVWV